MTIENLFVLASRKKYRFESKVGDLTVEELWDLPLTSATKANLDDIAIALNAKLKDTKESFVTSARKDEATQNKFEIIKHVIEVRVAENTARLEASKKAEQRTKLDELITRKQEEVLGSKSLEELIAERDAL